MNHKTSINTFDGSLLHLTLWLSQIQEWLPYQEEGSDSLEPLIADVCLFCFNNMETFRSEVIKQIQPLNWWEDVLLGDFYKPLPLWALVRCNSFSFLGLKVGFANQETPWNSHSLRNMKVWWKAPSNINTSTTRSTESALNELQTQVSKKILK